MSPASNGYPRDARKLMHKVTGGCHCGNILVEMELPLTPDAYNPRACDCDFCRKHGSAYVSDPRGSLLVRIKDERLTGKYRQGSETADCLLCRNCGVLIGAVHRGNGRLYAAVNAKVVDPPTNFGVAQPASPKQLSAGEKVTRWHNLWFSNVSIVGADI